MFNLILSSYLLFMVQSQVLYNFNSNSNPLDWQIVNDGVMGGRSKGHFEINDEGHGVFSGNVSLENNGGFTSIQHQLSFAEDAAEYRFAELRLKGDGKRYQFRIKANQVDRHSYMAYFQTSGSWETVSIPLSSMYPTFRGRRIDIPNFNESDIEQISFLISNKQEEQFELLIDHIQLKK